MSLRELKSWLSEHRQGPYHRTLLNLCLPEKELALYLNHILKLYSDILLLSTGYSTELLKQVPIEAYPQDKINHLLGTQVNAIVFDARNGINLSALYSATGLVKHAGVIVVLCPATMPNKPVEYTPIKFSYGDERTQANFLHKYYQSIFVEKMPFVSLIKCYLPAHLKVTEGIIESDNTQFQLSNEQQNIQREIVENIENESKHIILGGRGRGKSTLLGSIAHHIQSTLDFKIIVTAPNKRQICAMQRHYNTLIHNDELSELSLNFIPPDQCCDFANDKHVLIVDEMASIAPDLLRTMLKTYKTVILAGTTAGYEGSGQGFVQRLLPQINTTYHTKIHRLHRPFRWLENDPVEKFFDQLLCSVPVCIPETIATDVDNSTEKPKKLSTQFAWIDKQELVQNDNLYYTVFSLLQTAHYQTSPNDIVRILDSSDHIIGLTRAIVNNKLVVIGVVIAIIEGGETLLPLSKDISLGNRRVQGQLTPQSLALLLQDEAYACMRYLRITRIAVLHAYRNCLVGTRMLDECLSYAKGKQIAWLSSSFGLNDELLNFWSQSKFALSKIGNRTDTASGTNSVIVVKQVDSTSPYYLKLIQSKLLIDSQFYSFLYSNTKPEEKYLALLSSALLRCEMAKIANMKNSEYYNSLINKIILNFINGKIRLEQASSAILAFSLNNKDNIKLKGIPQKLVRYYKKGQHRADKLALEKEILDSIK